MKKERRGRKKKKRRGRKKKEEKRKKKEEVEIDELTGKRKRKSMVMINLHQVKLMNEENWVEIETTEIRKNVKKEDEE